MRTTARVIVPKLGDPLADVLAAGGLTTGEGDRGPELRYGPLRFPLAPGTEGLGVAEAVERQHYRLQWWRDPARNVRRFFTIDDLVAVRAEEPDIAEAIDTIPARLADHPAFAGVRVDHVDGLAQPEAYLDSLRERIGGHRWLLVEKILAPGETLPPSWPVDGTTGYEHIRVSEHTFLDPAAEAPLDRLWTDLTGDPRGFAEFEDQARREVLDGGLRPDLDRLVRVAAGQLAESDRSGTAAAGDVDDEALRQALVELTIGVHRYRTYLPDDAASVAELDDARRRAISARPDLTDNDRDVVELIRSVPVVATRWEQLTSPTMAKGAEDRAFYRYLRLPSLCEVGGSPGEFSTSVDEFHRHHTQVQATTPTTMLAGTTHDTKRSEGVRARSLALADHCGQLVRRRSFMARPPRRSRPRRRDRPARTAHRRHGVAHRHRPDDRVPGEVGSGSRPPHLVDRPRRRATKRPWAHSRTTLLPSSSTTRAIGARLGAIVTPDAPAGVGELACAARRPADRSGCSGRVPGHRVVHVLAGRPRQPGRTRLGRTACTRRRRS
jgi:(1->4)-alpha-D-glucan 1-alpha-D-glucosylmutase